VRDAGLRTGLLGLAWLAWLTPWLVCCWIASGAGVIGLGLRGRVVRANVIHVRAAEPVSWPRGWLIAFRQIATHWKMMIELLRANVRPLDPARLRVFGFEHLAPQLGRRGIVVVAPHAGPYPILGLLASPWLRCRGFTGEIVVVARIFRPFRSGALMDWFVSAFARAGVTVIPSDTPPRALALRLRSTLTSRGIVILFVDEPTPTECQLVPFFDAAIQLPLGPARLVAATKSVIAPCIATFGRARTMTLTIGPLIEPRADAIATTRKVAVALEQFIAPHLDQWAMLTPIWHSAATCSPSSAPEPRAG
jgi:lauroyl/myristoyl acyltransferase